MPTKRRGMLERVVQWRQARLGGAGFPRSLAARVARDERYDLHALIELVERGCSCSGHEHPRAESSQATRYGPVSPRGLP